MELTAGQRIDVYEVLPGHGYMGHVFKDGSWYGVKKEDEPLVYLLNDSGYDFDICLIRSCRRKVGTMVIKSVKQ
jgi:hypothetical protein